MTATICGRFYGLSDNIFLNRGSYKSTNPVPASLLLYRGR